MDDADRSFALLVVEKKLATREQVDECTVLVRKATEIGAAASLPDTLVSKGYLTREQADAALAELRRGETRITALGGYELLGKLGQGGMGMVYKARQVAMDRTVALKVLRPSLSRDTTFVQRFLREARSAAKLNHPNIVQGIDAGHEAGYHYFVMEFVDGHTVAHRLRHGGPFDEPDALRIVRGVADALAHAERLGIVHRDIKPDNIMLTRDGTPKLADLGLAKRTDAEGTLTLEGSAMGTPYYMSPEQARGEKTLDTRSDIYSLGATLFHMVTGTPPFAGDTAAVIVARRLTEPTPNPRVHKPDLSLAMQRLILKMMAKDPARRFGTASELVEAIDGALRGEVPVTRPATARRAGVPHHRPRTREARRSLTPWVAGAAGLLAVVIVVGIVLARRPSRRGPTPTAGGTVVSRRPDTRMGTAKKRQAEIAAQAEQTRKLQAALGKLRARVEADVRAQRFGDALGRVDAFAKTEGGQASASDVAKLRREIGDAAHSRFDALAAEADQAAERKDYATARAALKRVAAFGIPDLEAKARDKLAEIATREKEAEHLAKWQDIKGRVDALAKEGKFAEALALLAAAKDVPLADIAQRMAEAREAVEQAHRDATDEAVAAYTEQSAKVWELLKARKYGDAEKLLAGISQLEHARLAADHVGADVQAVKHLKAFWATVEKTVTAMKGKRLAIASPVATVADVKDGVVFLRAGGAEFRRRLDRLKVPRAISFAHLGDDPQAKLTLGIFLLAEGQLDDADKALAAAGDEPCVAIYKERLAVLRLGTREAVARKAWAEIERYAKPKLTDARSKRLLHMLDVFEQKCGTTRFAGAVGDKIASLRREAKAPARAEAVGDRRLNDIREWKASRGEWRAHAGGILGKGDGALTFRHPLPANMTLSFRMNVKEGMRPRVHFGGNDFYIGNEGFSRSLDLHGVVTKTFAKPFPYQNGREYAISLTMEGKKVLLRIDGETVVAGTRKAVKESVLTIQGGDNWSPGTTLFTRFRLLPAAEVVRVKKTPKRKWPLRFTIASRVDGDSELVIRPGGMYWVHRHWDKPKATTINGRRWAPTWKGNTSESLRIEGMPRHFRGLKCRVSKLMGRGSVRLSESSATRFSIRFNDAANGADNYKAQVVIYPVR